MGREVRRVPADWQHPKQDCPHSPWAGGCSEAKECYGMCYHPMFNEDFETRARKWLDDAIAWDNGDDPDKAMHPFFWQWDGDPPNPRYYRPKWTAEEMTHYQVYETVSEGTPISPVFATEEALIDWLVNDGGCDGKHSRKAAEAFVKNAWAPSMIIGPSGAKKGIDAFDDIF